MTRDPNHLAQENQQLGEQIKILVQTEQRLFRAQHEIDRQLERIRRLGDFALSCSTADTARSVVDRAGRLLTTMFDVERVVIAMAEQHGGSTAWRTFGSEEAAEELGPEAAEALLTWSGSAAVTIHHVEATTEVDRRPPDPCDPAGRLGPGIYAVVPLRDDGGGISALLLAIKPSDAQRSFHRQTVGDPHLPFLQLLGAHAEHALKNARLTETLRTRGAQLAEANERLATSLTRLETTQSQLIQSQKLEAIGQLAGGIAHDFNNLLTVVLGHGDLLRRTIGPDGPGYADAGYIVDAARGAARIVRQLLAFSRKQMRVPEPLDLGLVARETVSMLARLVGERITIDVRTEDSPSLALADRSQIEQILLNLVVNARDAIVDGGTISVSVATLRTPPATVELRVVDDGEGMDQATLARVFEPFFTTKDRTRGTGMGLATVYGLVAQNDAEISVDSELGRGTTFRILFPAVEGPAPNVAPVAHAEERRLEEVAVLVVEDETEIREMIGGILEAAGARVITAADGHDALRLVNGGSAIDVIVTDLALPGIDGAELCRRLRELRPGLPVLVLSGHAFGDTRVAAPSRFLAKPFARDELLNALGRLLR